MDPATKIDALTWLNIAPGMEGDANIAPARTLNQVLHL